MDNIDFLTWIANGFNPYTGEKLPETDLLQKSEVSLRLKAFADELSNDRIEEHLNGRNLIRIFYPETTIQPFAKAISYAIYNAQPFGFIQNCIHNFLLEENKLEFRYEYPESTKMTKFATEEGNLIGITDKFVKSSYKNQKHIVCYSPTAQIYIIDRLSEILKN